MPKLIIAEELKEKYLKPFGIKADLVRSTVERPDQTEVIEGGEGSPLRIHSKIIDWVQPSYCLVVVEQDKDGQRRAIFALKVYPDLAEDLTGRTPVEVLQLIANRFGIIVKVGRKRKRFILREDIPMEDSEDVPIAETTGGRSKHKYAMQVYCRVSQGPPRIIHCALAYCLDLTKYTQWLHSHRRRK